jgi:hypothetical protein
MRHVLQMCRMLCVHRQVTGFLQDGDQAEIESLPTVCSHRQGPIDLQLRQAWDLADHALGCARPGLHSVGGRIRLELEKDCRVERSGQT